MQHNGNAIQLVPPPPLGFPSFQLVQSLAKSIQESLSKMEAELRQNTGVALIIKQFEKPTRPQDSSLNNNDNHSTSSTSPTTPDNTQQFYETILSQHARPRPVINRYGHFMGETSYYCSLSSYMPRKYFDLLQQPSFSLLAPIAPPQLTNEDQMHLIEVYFTHIHPHLPLINKHDLLLELDHCNKGEPSYLSPMFFYALFARSAPFSTEPQRFIQPSSGQTIDSFSIHCLQYANQFRDAYIQQPRTSTVMALLFMAVYLEQRKQPKDFSRIWIWTGEAFRMILDLGLHRLNSFHDCSSSRLTTSTASAASPTASLPTTLCNSMASPNWTEHTEHSTLANTVFGQFEIRTFWAAFVIDRSMSLTCGRPFTLEEKDIDVPLPHCLEQDDKETSTWMTIFHDSIDISKIMGRIAKFNYAPHSTQRGPIRHQDAMLSTLDSWITSLLKDSSTCDENTTEGMTQLRHLYNIRLLALYSLLILLHRPYIQEHLPKMASSSGNTSKPSLDICSHTAMIITHLLSDIPKDDLIYLSKLSPFITYALILALRIHLINASASHDQKLVAFGEISFEQTLDQLRTIPLATGSDTMLTEPIDYLETQYKQRKAPIMSGFTRSLNKHHSSSSSSPRVCSLDPRLQSDGPVSSYDGDHSFSKRPYNVDGDYPLSGVSNVNGNLSTMMTTAKPLQRLKIIEVHPFKGKQKKHKPTPPLNYSSVSTPDTSADYFTHNNATVTTPTTSKSSISTPIKNDSNNITDINMINDTQKSSIKDDSKSISSSVPGLATTANIPSKSTSVPYYPNINPSEMTHSSNTTINNVNIDPETVDHRHYIQEHQPKIYQQQQHDHQNISSITATSSSSSSSISSSSNQPGLDYNSNTLFTVGDGLTGDYSSLMLYDTMFTSPSQRLEEQQQRQQHEQASVPTSMISTSSGAAIANISSSTTTTSSQNYSAYMDPSQLVYGTGQPTTPSLLFIPPHYLSS
ncbi:fungal-specific transcription factor domain-containing protein [Halteromyces radiatus]|uniref:fungal-specific transcription factor domain-containing protein n=1 Tax=Halteromyces radiatus TaxID=101107 RepID=UPI002220CD2A|nr:fungal-specific transcription factor domain-containing protein [Halteromyces radiatus]KAI8084808.1 fungal-specific transcription factor domain-containing protein [Halteromyces radiatus]